MFDVQIINLKTAKDAAFWENTPRGKPPPPERAGSCSARNGLEPMLHAAGGEFLPGKRRTERRKSRLFSARHFLVLRRMTAQKMTRLSAFATP
jgi:hypothetical protein